jgi:hypothetical protein
MLAALTLFGAGCGGINAGGNVSPAAFFLKNDAKPAGHAPATALVRTNQFAFIK